MPSTRRIAQALSYIMHAFVISDFIHADQWAEGLAMAHDWEPSVDDYRIAREVEPQLTASQWAEIAARAELIRSGQIQ